MKKIFLFIGAISFIAASILYAQQKITEEEALSLIQQYRNREAAAREKIEEETKKIKSLEKEIAALDEKISSLTAKLSKLKEEAAKPKYTIYVVKKGDWLSKLAEYKEVYGHGNYRYWKKIYEANRDLIKDPNLIYPGQELKVPPLTEEEKTKK